MDGPLAYLKSQPMWEDKFKKWSMKIFTWYVSDHDFGIRMSVWNNKALVTKEQWKSRTSSNLLFLLLIQVETFWHEIGFFMNYISTLYQFTWAIFHIHISFCVTSCVQFWAAILKNSMHPSGHIICTGG